MRRAIAGCLILVGTLLPACAAPTTTSVPDDGPVVAFYGDSYTRGTGASDPSVRWSTRIAESRGWQEFNPSVDGLGYINNREAAGADLPGQIISADPDIVLITMGLNDVFSYGGAGGRIRQQIERDFERLHEALPDARLIVVEPFWYTDDRPASLEVIIEWVRDEAEDIGADHIPGASYWIQGRDGEMALDGIHPNDHGYDTMTDRMDAALSELGL